MLVISLVSTIVYLAIVPFFSVVACSAHYTRVAVLVAFICLTLGTFLSVESVDLYHSLFNYSSFTIVIDFLLYTIIALVVIGFSPRANIRKSSAYLKVDNTKEEVKSLSEAGVSLKPEYSLILMFSVLGASMMISASDMISIYVALELQSFGLYLLACLRTEDTGSTHASLKYFLLGAISSAFILLGISIVYQEVGSTQFQNIHSFLLTCEAGADMNVELINSQTAMKHMITDNNIMSLGVLSILCGFMFKISAAPFHSWFADVIQGVPTYTSMVIINLPKISIFTFLFHLLLTMVPLQGSSWEIFIVITTIFSLILGTVAGLMQTKIKRLLAFSTISHVGFILIGLTVDGSEVSLNAIMFYLVQYTLTVVLTFLVLIAYETSSHWAQQVDLPSAHVLNSSKTGGLNDKRLINYIVSLKGVVKHDKLLTFTLVLCLFSIAGIPPIAGFYAKLGVLNGSILQNMSLVFVTAIVCSIISAAYYLKIIKVLMFDTESHTYTSDAISKNLVHGSRSADLILLSPVHSFTMSCLTAFLTLFILDNQIIINCTELVALNIYIT